MRWYFPQGCKDSYSLLHPIYCLINVNSFDLYKFYNLMRFVAKWVTTGQRSYLSLNCLINFKTIDYRSLNKNTVFCKYCPRLNTWKRPKKGQSTVNMVNLAKKRGKKTIKKWNIREKFMTKKGQIREKTDKKQEKYHKFGKNTWHIKKTKYMQFFYTCFLRFLVVYTLNTTSTVGMTNTTGRMATVIVSSHIQNFLNIFWAYFSHIYGVVFS